MLLLSVPKNHSIEQTSILLMHQVLHKKRDRHSEDPQKEKAQVYMEFDISPNLYAFFEFIH